VAFSEEGMGHGEEMMKDKEKRKGVGR